MTRTLTIVALAVLCPATGRATVLFENSGVKAGWSSLGIQHMGKIDEVAEPTFDGPRALRMEQTFEGFSGYHSEVRLHEAQGPMGSDVYYGMTLYLPPNWKFHGQNVTFQQWARGDEFGSPWVLMYVENDEIRTGGSGGIRGVMAKITNMQGRWIRVVTHIRHHSTDGVFEVWVDGVKGFTFNGRVSPAPAAPIRWSAGMYCTRWREEQPAGLNPMVLFQDHYRVATTYAEAEPMSWKGGTGPSPMDAGANTGVDAGAAADSGPPAPLDTAPAGGADASTPSGPDASAPRPADARPRTPDPVEEPEEPVSPPRQKADGGCQVAGANAVGAPSILLAALLTLAARRRRR